MDRLTVWLHLLGIGVYAAATLAMPLVILPRAARAATHAERVALLARAFAWLNPLVIAVLGVVLMSGAFALTATKARLGPAFFAHLGGPLAVKLALVFVLVLGATWLTFGLGHRIVRAHQWGDPLPPERLASMVRRLRAGALVNLALTAWIVWVALRMPD